MQAQLNTLDGVLNSGDIFIDLPVARKQVNAQELMNRRSIDPSTARYIYKYHSAQLVIRHNQSLLLSPSNCHADKAVLHDHETTALNGEASKQTQQAI